MECPLLAESRTQININLNDDQFRYRPDAEDNIKQKPRGVARCRVTSGLRSSRNQARLGMPSDPLRAILRQKARFTLRFEGALLATGGPVQMPKAACLIQIKRVPHCQV